MLNPVVALRILRTPLKTNQLMRHREITCVAELYTINCQHRHMKTLTELNNVAITFKKATHYKQKMIVAIKCTDSSTGVVTLRC